MEKNLKLNIKKVKNKEVEVKAGVIDSGEIEFLSESESPKTAIHP